jgi:threonine aldolase
MAKKLAESLSEFPQLNITQEVKANGVFCTMPPEIIPQLQQEYFFHVWNEKPSLVGEAMNANVKEVRLMCSWDTTAEDIEGFVSLIREKLS